MVIKHTNTDTTTSIIYWISDAIRQRIMKTACDIFPLKTHMSTEESRYRTLEKVWLVTLSTFIPGKGNSWNVSALHTKERAQLTLLLNYWSIDRPKLIEIFVTLELEWQVLDVTRIPESMCLVKSRRRRVASDRWSGLMWGVPEVNWKWDVPGVNYGVPGD